MNPDKETTEKIMELQLAEQGLQNSLMQKQALQTQLAEIESALKEIGNVKDTYKIIGNIMVSNKKEDLKQDLNEKKDIINLRIKNLDKQEEKLKEKTSQLQEELLKKMKKQ